jgi:hypothetical protein
MQEEQPKLDENKWTEMRKIKAANSTGWSYFESLVKTMHKTLGEEKCCSILSELMKENAQKYVAAGMKKFNIEGNDAWALASYFKLATGDVIGYKAELVKESEKKVYYRLYPPCLWFPKLDIPPSFCRALGTMEVEACKIINPNIKVRFEKLMTAGDPYCELVFEEE